MLFKETKEAEIQVNRYSDLIASMRFFEVSGLKFIGVDFSWMSLMSAWFDGCELENCRFDRADLSHARFDGATIKGCSFRGANLFNTCFRDVHFEKCNFTGSLELGETNLVGTDFAGADMGHHYVFFPRGYVVNTEKSYTIHAGESPANKETS